MQTNPSAQAEISCTYFDGSDSTAHPATLAVVGSQLHITGAWGERFIALADINVSERLGSAPRLITLPAGAACELPGGAGTNAFLSTMVPRESLWFRAQFDWRWIAASIASLAVVAVLGYRYGVPLAANVIAERAPPIVAKKISDVALAELDRTILNPSKLSEARQRTLTDQFTEMLIPEGQTIAHRVEFRDGGRVIGANAFALPSGTIVMTDQLVNLLNTDEQVLGVLAHELGHVKHKHGLKNLIQASVIGAAVAYWIGDFSAVIAGGTTALLQTHYSRAYETEADDFGAAMMRANGQSGEPLASALELLEAGHNKSSAASSSTPAKSSPAQTGTADKKAAKSSQWSDYISTHPNTTQRVERLRKM
jgi:Zn-dependent protease with chaperone function